MPEPRSAPTVGQIILGVRLRQLREQAGCSFADAAGALSVNTATVRRMEKAEVALKPPYVEKLLRSYGVDEEQAASFLAHVEQANRPGWWHEFRDVLSAWSSRYLGLEQAASLIRSYASHCVPALLQTPEYARALLAAAHPHAGARELERRVELWTRRRALLERPVTGGPGTERTRPTRLWTVLDEQVLLRRVGDAHVMRKQLEHLEEVCRTQPNVTVQIVRLATGAHPAMYGPFQLLRFELPELPDVVYAETLIGADYVDQRRETAAFLEALDRLSALAEPAHETPALVREAAQRGW